MEDEMRMEHIGKRVKYRRKQLNLKLNELQSICGISSGALSGIEHGNRTPSVTAFYKLAEALQCSVDWLITGEHPNFADMDISDIDYAQSDVESKLLNNFRQLEQIEQKEFIGILDLKLRKANGKL